MQKAQAAGRGLYGDTAGLQSLTAAQLKRVHISGRQGVHVPTLEEFLRYVAFLCHQHICLSAVYTVNVQMQSSQM